MLSFKIINLFANQIRLYHALNIIRGKLTFNAFARLRQFISINRHFVWLILLKNWKRSVEKTDLVHFKCLLNINFCQFVTHDSLCFLTLKDISSSSSTKVISLGSGEFAETVCSSNIDSEQGGKFSIDSVAVLFSVSSIKTVSLALCGDFGSWNHILIFQSIK